MTDPIITAARRAVEGGFATLRRAVEGLPAEALNWRPAGEETNSIAVLVTHAASATRLLLHLALGLPVPPRDRDAEFSTRADDAAELLGFVDELAADCVSALDRADAPDWGTMRQRTRSDGETVQIPAADALIHAIDHLRGHADEASLTRHVWSAGR